MRTCCRGTLGCPYIGDHPDRWCSSRPRSPEEPSTETRLAIFEEGVQKMRDIAVATDPFAVAGELRGFVLGMTGVLLRDRQRGDK